MSIESRLPDHLATRRRQIAEDLHRRHTPEARQDLWEALRQDGEAVLGRAGTGCTIAILGVEIHAPSLDAALRTWSATILPKGTVR